jgi:hypothetical protein
MRPDDPRRDDIEARIVAEAALLVLCILSLVILAGMLD